MSQIRLLKCDACDKRIEVNFDEEPRKDARSWRSVRVDAVVRAGPDAGFVPSKHSCSSKCAIVLLRRAIAEIEAAQ